MSYDFYNVRADRVAGDTTTLHTPESYIKLAPPPLADVIKKIFLKWSPQ